MRAALRGTLLVVLVFAPPAFAADNWPPTPPEYALGKPSMSQKEWLKKNEGAYNTAVPLITFDPDFGMGYGARVFHYENGSRSDETFAYEPYRYRMYGQLYATSNGLQSHQITLDAPFFLKRPQRLRAELILEENTSTHYSTVDDFWIRRPFLTLSLEQLTLGSRLRVVTTAQLSNVEVRTAAQTAPEITAQCASGELLGCTGGMNNTFKLGIAYDLIDFEPNPHSGSSVEVAVQGSSKTLGSEQSYARATLQGKWMRPLSDHLDNWVVATRALIATQSDDVPFYDRNVIALADTDINGLGGRRTLRGFRRNRFLGKYYQAANFELRYTVPHEIQIASHRFELLFAPFYDIGRASENWEHTQGLGTRLIWNQATILSFDYGRSRDGSGLYISFGHAF